MTGCIRFLVPLSIWLCLAGQATYAQTNAPSRGKTGSDTTTVGSLSTRRVNMFQGYRSGVSNTSGRDNTFMGLLSGMNNTSGSMNCFIGSRSGLSNRNGSGNFFLGDESGKKNVSGNYNVYLGAGAGNGTDVNGSYNVAVGSEAGVNNASGTTNTFLGYKADASQVGLTNATAIGAHAVVSASNSLVLGAETVQVGVGISAPQNRLHVSGGIPQTAGIRLGNLTAASVPVSAASKFLTVNEKGDIILAGLEQTSLPEKSEFWVAAGDHIQNANPGGVVIGSGEPRAPAGYRLFVEEGILTEKVKVAIRTTDDWSDKVFDAGYKLLSLPAVDKYIKQHGHLPGIPSAGEMVSGGMDVAWMNAKLLEKVEEITLHLIRMQKDNYILHQRNADLTAQLTAQQHELQTLKQKQAELEKLVQTALKKSKKQ